MKVLLVRLPAFPPSPPQNVDPPVGEGALMASLPHDGEFVSTIRRIPATGAILGFSIKIDDLIPELIRLARTKGVQAPNPDKIRVDLDGERSIKLTWDL